MPFRVAIDTGGTFTDCVYLRDGRPRVLKLTSTPADPGEAVLAALTAIAAELREAPGEVRHGTTVGTNTLLERNGARVAFVTTAGFEDTIAIGRQARAHLYDWSYAPPPSLAPAELRRGVVERVSAEGRVLRSPRAADLAKLRRDLAAAGAEAIAVSLLFSFAHPAHERAVARALAPLGLPISLSHEILPEFREFERGAAVVINAYLAPRVGRYLGRLDERLAARARGARLAVMQSSGGIIGAATAAREPVRTILSGPAGGVVGAHAVAARAGCLPIITFDMGGTSTDVALVDAAGPVAGREGAIAGLPVAVPMLEVHTVGAGGGSIARFDAGGALRVGPQSAGADPGPICYGRGEEPTVTDANLLLGRLPHALLGGGLPLDAARVRAIFARRRGPLAGVEAFAEGIVRVAEATMERALRAISIERGRDPREATLVAFGGAGPLHACALAAALGMHRVLVPPLPGALSALGILLADLARDYSRTLMLPFTAHTALEKHFRELERRGRRELRGKAGRARALRSLDLRYAGQGYELTLPCPGREGVGARLAARFHAAHERRYGFSDPKRPIEIVTARVRLIVPAPALRMPRRRERPGDGAAALAGSGAVIQAGRRWPARQYQRERLRPGDRFAGPALIHEYSATSFLPPGWRARVDGLDNLWLEPR
ncbi:MAG TPA: hydantoinase/oxoprolinase family protein [Terriglobales bacterium]|nr:hydantoinase/oxoprolinase family protein [Terriglobales bacterium]